MSSIPPRFGELAAALNSHLNQKRRAYADFLLGMGPPARLAEKANFLPRQSVSTTTSCTRDKSGIEEWDDHLEFDAKTKAALRFDQTNALFALPLNDAIEDHGAEQD